MNQICQINYEKELQGVVITDQEIGLVINLNLSIVHTVGLHIPPIVLEYGTPVFNVNQDVNEKTQNGNSE